MLNFDVTLTAGRPASEQVIAAVHRAVAAGRLKPGDEFPSVRKLSAEVGINPNTAHKIVAALTAGGVLEVLPGLGTRVAAPKTTPAAQRMRELAPLAGQIVVLAKRLGASPAELDALLH